MAGNLQQAYNAIVSACNDPYIGYQASVRRTTITLGVNYITYCDCSSLIAWGLTQGGFFDHNPWFTTANETACLLQAGFQQLPNTVELMAGDILWCDGYNAALKKQRHHTEMVYEAFGTNARTMGAHTDSYEFSRQVSINDFMVSGTTYNAVFRYGGGGIVPINISWSQGDGTFAGTITAEQKYNNGALIAYYFTQLGATREVIAGILGNLDHESGFDPNIWLDGRPGSAAYGLPQFNPSSGYRNLAQSQGVNLNDADANANFQLKVISENLLGGWLPTRQYPYTWEEFLKITDTKLACDAFYYEYERGGDAQYHNRDQLAYYWYDEIPNFPSNIGNPSTPFFPYLPGIICDLKRRKILL